MTYTRPLVTPRRCDHCGTPLPAVIRHDARYCPGGACKQAAYRARIRDAA